MILLPPIEDELEFRAFRREGVGASDVAALLGLSPWESPWSLWSRKVGLLTDDIPVSDAMQHGHWAEGAILPWYAKTYGRGVGFSQFRAIGPEPWMRATLDGLGFDSPDGSDDPDDATELIECKATPDTPAKWQEGIPVHYMTQAAWQSIVTGIPTVRFAVLHVPFGRVSFAVYEHTPSDDDKALIQRKAAEFWALVEAGTPPPVDGSDATTDALQAAWGDTTDEALELDLLTLDAVRYREDCRELVKFYETKQAEWDNKIRAALGEHEKGEAEGWRVTWKPVTRTGVDVKALRAEMPEVADKFATTTTTRVLRVTPPKGE